MASEVDLAWAAGLFEGEGCINVYRQKGRKFIRITLSLCSTDRDVVERFAKIVGYKEVTELKRYTKKNKIVYRWQTAHTEHVKRILRELMPYFGKRRTRQASDALVARRNYEEQRNAK